MLFRYRADGARRGSLALVSLSQIRYFVAVAEEGHVGRAARRLHVSQPPLSRSIRSLEEELGADLFERTPRGMRLLPAGNTFLAHARNILGAVDAAVVAVSAAPGIAASSTGSSRPLR
jgi:DNA-binding transcriptional LysR family regulator